MNKTKVIIIKTINVLSTGIIYASAALALLGFVSTTNIPELSYIVPPFMASLSTVEVILGSTSLGGIATGAGIYKFAARAIRRHTNLEKLETKAKLRHIEEKHEKEMQALENKFSDFIEVVVPILNKTTVAVENQNMLLTNIQSFNVISAKRNSKMEIISEEDRLLYKEYIKSVSSFKPYKAKQLNVTINKIVEKLIDEENKEASEETQDSAWKL